jgi:hypothetical protein
LRSASVDSTADTGALADKGLRCHHIGIATKEPRGGAINLEKFGMHTSGYETSPNGVEWLGFDPDSPKPELAGRVPRRVPFLAFSTRHRARIESE